MSNTNNQEESNIILINNPSVTKKEIKEVEEKKKQYDSTSMSSEESENSKRLKRKYEIDYKTFSKSSMSSCGKFKRSISEQNFPVVVEEKNEEDNENLFEEENMKKFHMLNEKIQNEGIDFVEEEIIDNNSRHRKYTKSNKTLIVMDPVKEEEDVDLEFKCESAFKKIKCLMDYDEDSKIKNNNTSNLYLHSGTKYLDQTIEEDNDENEVEYVKIKPRNKFSDFIDKSEILKEIDQSYQKDIITEEIKEVPEQDDEFDFSNSKGRSY